MDVIALKDGLPDRTLQQDDFQVFDNGRAVQLKTFESGAHFASRPLTLWFIVQCRMTDWDARGSGLFRGHTAGFKPAFGFLEKQDRVAVAHWCDDGDFRTDLLPTDDSGAAVTALEQILAPVVPENGHGRSGELALQKMLQLVIDNTRSTKPEPLPVVIFLYGDWSAMPKSEADHFVDQLLETSAVAYGLRDPASPHLWWLIGEQKEVAHYIARETGGQYFEASPDSYATVLQEILQQLHARYELVFKPEVLDGKRHKLVVKLSDSAAKRHRGVRLRYRAAYLAER